MQPCARHLRELEKLSLRASSASAAIHLLEG
jgi:hypothetical protein